METLNFSKGQSAIEYLTTYGWMLLVVAIVGGSIFTTVQGQTQVQQVSGLSNADVRIDDFGVTQTEGLKIELIGANSNQISSVNLSLKDDETGRTVYGCNEKTIPVAGSKTVSVSGVESSQNVNAYKFKISYDSGQLEDLTETGSIKGRMKLNESLSCQEIVDNKDSTGDKESSTTNFQLYDISDNGSVTEGETLGVEYTVHNEGANEGAQDVVLDVNGSQESVESSVSLAADSSTSGTLTWSTENGDSGDGIDYTVSSNNDSVMGKVDVGEVSGSTTTWSIAHSTAPECSKVTYNGSGTSSSPYNISNDWQLQCIESNDISGHYQIIQNINASATDKWSNGGFESIGSASKEFTGVLDGNYHAVKNLTVQSGENTGLLSEMNGEVRQVRLSKVAIEGDIRLAGGIVGVANSDASVSRSYVTGKINSSESDGYGDRIGGIVGVNSGQIDRSYVNVNVKGSGDMVGALVGNNNGGVVNNSYTRGNVSSGGRGIGGLIGLNEDGTVANSFSTAHVSSSSSYKGGLTGDGYGSVSDSYWDVPASGQDSSALSAVGFGSLSDTAPIENMTGSDASGNMTGLDFTSTWEEREDSNYPALAWE